LIYGYARVSTTAQDHAGQVAELTAAGCGQVFSEKVSGATAKRPQLAKALRALEPGDVLIVTDRGAGFRSLGEPWADTTTAAGRFMVTVFSGLAEFDREQILARTREGRATAQRRGVKMGRKPALTGPQRVFVVKARAEHPPVPISELTDLLKVSRSTICRAIREGGPAGGEGQVVAEVFGDPSQVDLEELTGRRPGRARRPNRAPIAGSGRRSA
jgi:DNA invertase Pin-like site-specific DNA recombinase